MTNSDAHGVDSAERVLELMRAHRSVREFDTTPIPDAHIRRAVQAAQSAATSSNGQAYSLLHVRDADERAQLAELAGNQKYVESNGAFFVVLADLRRHQLIAQRDSSERVENLETFLLATIDAALFAQNLALAFEAMQYGTCFIGGLRNRLREVDALLELPRGVLPLFGLCVGRPMSTPTDTAADAARRPRIALDAILWERRAPDDSAALEQVAAYDEVMEKYYERRGKPGWNWSTAIRRKFARPNRPELRTFFEHKGASFD